MKTVIFAGGLGSRISEESHLKPKPMIEIGGKPMLWHLLKLYSFFGYSEFVICLGYKGYVIKEYFMNYFAHNSDVTIDLGNNDLQVHKSDSLDVKVTLVDTGVNTLTAGRLKRVQKYLKDEDFMLTYGDGLADINLNNLVEFHKKQKRVATVTSVQPAGKFGVFEKNDLNVVTDFTEKPKQSGNWINGGFFVLNKQVFEYLPNNADNVMWEQQPLHDLVRDGQLAAYEHKGFWKCMDILRDKEEFEKMWDEDPKWRLWK